MPRFASAQRIKVWFEQVGRRAALRNAFVASTLVFTSTSALANRPALKYKSGVALKASPQKTWASFKTVGSIHEWHRAAEGTQLLVGQNGKPLAVRAFQIKGTSV